MYTAIKIKDYKCFTKDLDYQGFNNIKPINVIIGKNNSGKSKLLEALEFIVKNNGDLPFSAQFQKVLKEEELKRIFPQNVRSVPSYLSCVGNDWDDVGSYLVGKKILLQQYGQKLQLIDINIHDFTLPKTDIIKKIQERIHTNYLQKYTFLHLKSERDIKKEPIKHGENINSFNIAKNADGISAIIARMLNDESGNDKGWQNFIEQSFLEKINEIVKPETNFTRIYTKISSNNEHEIYLEEKNKGGIKLSDCGSGLKTIIATLTLLHIAPYLMPNRNFIFALEELENNMHPSLERKLLVHIDKYIASHPDNYVFLTTHSNVSIDLFSSNPNAQILKVCNDGYSSTVETVSTDDDKRKLLNDLGVKASDILQANSVIWVEGPSDRIYIKKWMELFSSDLKFEEGLHYQFLFYGGALLSHYSTTEQDPFINLLKINKNSYIIMDSDKRTKQTPLKNRVKRIQNELKNQNNYWITKGREIENYLPDNVLSSYFDKAMELKIFDSFPEIYKKSKKVTNFDKVKFASEIVNLENYTLENLKNQLDLQKKIHELLDFIKKSNLENC